MSSDSSDDRSGTVPPGANRDEFQRSVDRLERAVDGLVSAANERISSRAADFIDDTAARLERELRRRKRSSAEVNDELSRRERRRARRQRRRDYYRFGSRHRSMSVTEPGYRTSRLYVDKEHRKVLGVCAGIARYLGVEMWVVRVIAITGLIFMSSVVVPAYIILAIVMPRMPGGETAEREGNVDDDSSPAPELGARLSPRSSLRNVQAELDQLELKLRRMESHVTSGQFELQRELRRIDA
jgi:phage shock protein C